MSAAAGAGTSSAAALAHIPAVAVGAPGASVFVKRAGQLDASFAPVNIFAGDSVGHLAKRASSDLNWPGSADKVKLFLLSKYDAEDIAEGRDVVGVERNVFDTLHPLSSIKELSTVSVVAGSCLLARLAEASAAVPGGAAVAAGTGDSRVVALLKGINIGLDKLASGLDKLASGQDKLASGLDKLASGQDKLASGQDKLASEMAKMALEFKSEVLAIKSELGHEDASSWMSPGGPEYEGVVNANINEWLETFCGLRVISTGRHGIAATDAAAGGVQWDARFSVLLISPWSPLRADSDSFYVYGGGDYTRPDPPTQLRIVSPSKCGESPDAHFLTVLEFSSYDGWTRDWTEAGTRKVRKGLPQRLEARLKICLERFKEAGNAASSVLDAVALVGVVSIRKCQDSMEDLIADPACQWPLLKAMFLAKRFVYFYCFTASPRARLVVQGPVAGHGGIEDPVAALGGSGSA